MESGNNSVRWDESTLLNTINDSTIKIYDPEERKRRFGIECIGPYSKIDGISFLAGKWRPGGEYIHKLIVRNVSAAVKKLKYKLPSSRYFSMPYPEVITLSPGMFKEIDVIFRPVEHEPYDDTIYFRIQEVSGNLGFHIPVRAMIDKLMIQCPDGVDMGFCTAYQESTVTFKMVNTGEDDAPFRWEAPKPFAFEPMKGTIPVGHSQDITVTIFPTDASVYVSRAVCHVGEGAHALIPEPLIAIKLSAIGKYAYIVLSELDVAFGEILSGTNPHSIKKDVVLRNNSPVPAEFTVIRQDNDLDEVFSISPRSGTIPPLCEIPVYVTYRALATGCFSLDRYTFKTPGNCTTTLTCTGMSISPQVSLFKENNNGPEGTGTFFAASPADSINFQDLEVGNKSTRVFYLSNDGHSDIAYSVISDLFGVFKVSPKQGVVPAKMQRFAVKVYFSPEKPINYYRRIFVLITDALPLFFDVMGTGFIRANGEIKEQRPAPIRQAHIQAFRNRSVIGLGKLNPDELDALYAKDDPNNANLFAIPGKIGTQRMAVASLQHPLTRMGDFSRTVVAPAHEFFIDDDDPSTREISVNNIFLNFDYTPHMQTSDPQKISITNRTRGKVSVVWEIPRYVYSAGEAVLTKSKNNVDDETQSKGEAVFTIIPNTLDINPGKSESFQVIFKPKQSNRNFTAELEAYVFFKNQRTFRLVNDFTLTPPWCVIVNARGHSFSSGRLLSSAQLTGNNVKDGKLVFPHAYLNDSIYQTVVIKNTSDFPSTFRFEIGWGENDGAGAGGTNSSRPSISGRSQTTGDGIFSVKPLVGEIGANDFALISIRFNPREVKKFVDVLTCFVNGTKSSKLLLEGSAAVPYLTLPDLIPSENTISKGLTAPVPIPAIPIGQQGTFFLQPTCVGLSSSRSFTIKNNSRLPLRYLVTMPSNAIGIVSIYPVKGILRGNEVLKVTISFAPSRAVSYDFKAKIRVYPIGGTPVASKVLDARQPGQVNPPELLQTLSFNIIAPAEVGALIFDPIRTNVDVRLVNTWESKDIFIENVSDTDLKYIIKYRMEFTPDTGKIAKICVISDLLSIIREESNGDSSKRNQDHNLFCEYPSGILPARSRLRIPFTFYPLKSGLFEFLISAEVQAIDADGDVTMIPNEEAILLRLSKEMIYMNNNNGNNKNNLGGLPLTTNITARAAFPTLLFEDIRCDEDTLVADVEQLWRQFSFSSLNRDLAIPLTDEEILLFSASSPDFSLFKRYNFSFTPSTIGSPLQSLSLRLTNSGYLATAFHIHLPNEKELDLESWCDEDEPSEELNMLISIIEELKCFTIEPRHAFLEPGESVNVTISYCHSYLKYGGLHKLPLLVRIAQGKHFFIDLIGRTLTSSSSSSPALLAASQSAGLFTPTTAQSQSRTTPLSASSNISSSKPLKTPGNGITPFNQANINGNNNPFSAMEFQLWIPSESTDILHLAHVPIGLNASWAPRQRIELFNVGAVTCDYEIDMKPLIELNEDNFNQPLIRIANPDGIISSRSSAYIEVYFYPLECKTYEFDLKITYKPANKLHSQFFAGDSAASSSNSSTVFPSLSRPPSSNTLGRRSAPQSANSSGSPKRTSGKGSRKPPLSAQSQNQDDATTIIGTPQTLLLTVRITGYDPRDVHPFPYGSDFIGGIPPSTQLIAMSIPKQQLATLSSDIISFNVIPQCSLVHRLLVFRNNTSTSSIEYFVDDRSCILMTDNLLEIQPSYGTLEPGEHVVMNFKLVANTQPLAFEEKVKIIIREMIKVGNKSKGGMNTKLLEKIRKKTTSVEHESIVTRPTVSRTIRIDQSDLQGRTGSLPSTVTSTGTVIAVPISESLAKVFGETNNANTNATLAGDTYDNTITSANLLEIPSIETPSLHYTNNNRQSPPGLMRQISGISRNSSTSPLRGGQQTNSINSNNNMLMPKSASSVMSRSSKGIRSEMNIPLFGASNVLIVRLKGEIVSIDSMEKLFTPPQYHNLPNRNTLPIKSFIIPPAPMFIPPVSITSKTDSHHIAAGGGGLSAVMEQSSTLSSSRLATPPASPSLPSSSSPTRAASPMQLHNGAASNRVRSTSEDNRINSMGLLSQSASRSTITITTSGGGMKPSAMKASSSPTSATHAKFIADIPKTREPEIRNIVDFIFQDLFHSILNCNKTQEYLHETFKSGLLDPTDSEPASSRALHIKESTNSTKDYWNIAGSPVFGVYFDELSSTLPLYAQLVREVKLLGFHHYSINASSNKLSQQHSSGDMVIQIPAGDELNEFNILVGAEQFTMSTEDFKSALRKIGLSTKGAAYKAILVKISPVKSVCVATLLKKLNDDCLNILSKKISECYKNRLRAEKLSRRTIPLPSSFDVNNPNDVFLSRSPTDSQAEAEAAAEEDFDDPYSEKKPKLSQEEIQRLAEENAILKIQKISRGTNSRVLTDQIVQEKIDQQAMLALNQDGFLELAADILRNTMFNILQEASFGEFPITSEPMRFMYKK